MDKEFDVIICGSGSAGVCAGAWLARYGIKFKILERRSGPLVIGQADGVQCRTVEIYESFGLSEALLNESYHLLEMTFWSADGHGGIQRTNKAEDTPLSFSHLPHVTLNQARMNNLMLEAIREAGGQEVDYGSDVRNVEVDTSIADDPEAYAVKVTAVKNGITEEYRAKYVLGCDGAHSTVRRSLGFNMVGDSTDVVWGVMDVYPRTTYPDIRRKFLIHSESGTLLNIPREEGALTRFYIELDSGTSAKDVRLEELQNTARSIFKPYPMEFAETAWWSAYSVGQRRAECFHKNYRVFLAGDACHTHSPKAGQGMNTSLQDGYNIGWKLGAVVTGRMQPSILKTYVYEREKVAKELLDFDQKWVKLFLSKGTSHDEPLLPDELFERYGKGVRFMAGLTIQYLDSPIISSSNSSAQLAKHVEIGMRFPSSQVVRYCDARAVQLAKLASADGRWRLMIFAGDISSPSTMAKLEQLATSLDSQDGPIRKFTQPGADIDSLIEPIVIFAGDRWTFDQEQLPEIFWPETGKWRMRDLYKIYFDDESYRSGHGHAYQAYGIDPEVGALLIIRPDQHVAAIYSLMDHGKVQDFFGSFMIPQ